MALHHCLLMFAIFLELPICKFVQINEQYIILKICCKHLIASKCYTKHTCSATLLHLNHSSIYAPHHYSKCIMPAALFILHFKDFIHHVFKTWIDDDDNNNNSRLKSLATCSHDKNAWHIYILQCHFVGEQESCRANFMTSVCRSLLLYQRGLYWEAVVYLLASAIPNLHLFRLSIHAGFPWISRHLWHGDEHQTDSTDEEQDKARAGTSKRPGIVILDPDCVLAFYHPLD